MSKPDFTIAQGDLLPSMLATLRFDDGTIADLTTATLVQARFIHRVTEAIPSPVIITGAATVLSATDGTIRYDFVATQTDVEGDYNLVFRATFPGGFETFPNNGYLHLQITEALA